MAARRPYYALTLVVVLTLVLASQASLGADKQAPPPAAPADVNAKDKDGWTALMLAARDGQLAKLKELLAAGADLTVHDANGWTAARLAGLNGQADCLGALLAAGADQHGLGLTEPMVAAVNGNSKALATALAARGDLAARDDQGKTALMWAAAKGDLPCLCLLLKDHDRDERYVTAADEAKNTALMWAARRGSEACLKWLLSVCKYRPAQGMILWGRPERKAYAMDQVNDDGATALSLAAAFGHAACVQLLLDSGVTETCIAGKPTALIHAVECGDQPMVHALLAFGAKQPLGGKGHYASLGKDLDQASYVNWRGEGGRTALAEAAARGHKEVVQPLLAAGAKCDLGDEDGWTPLMASAAAGLTDTVKVLLDAGADVAKQDRKGNTALMRAAAFGNLACVNLLLQAHGDVNAANQHGHTALTWAAGEGDLARLDALIHAGANVNAADQDGWTALSYVANRGQIDSVKVLLAAGADATVRSKDNRRLMDLTTDQGCRDLLAPLVSEAEAAAKLRANEQRIAEARNARRTQATLRQAAAAQEAKAGEEDRQRRAAADLPRVRELVAAHGDLNARDDLGLTPLTLACQACDETGTRELLAAGVDVNLKDLGGNTALMWAAHASQPGCAAALLAAGADWKVQADVPAAHSPQTAGNYDGWVKEVAAAAGITDLTWTEVETIVEIPYGGAYLGCVTSSLHFKWGAGHTLTAPYGQLEHAPLEDWVIGNRYWDVGKSTRLTTYDREWSLMPFLEAAGLTAMQLRQLAVLGSSASLRAHAVSKLTDPEMVGQASFLLRGWSKGSDALVEAVRSDAGAVVAALLAAGADANGRDASGQRLLTVASRCGSATAVRALLKGGASLELAAADLANPPVAAPGGGRGPMSGLRLPQDRSVDARTPLLVAIRAGSPATVRALIDGHASVEQADRDGSTPLMLAASTGQVDSLRCLLEAGADVKARDPRGATALMVAAAAGEPDCLSLLLASGSELNAKDNAGSTALATAKAALTKADKEAATRSAEWERRWSAFTQGLVQSVPDLRGPRPDEKPGLPEVVQMLEQAGAKE